MKALSLSMIQVLKCKEQGNDDEGNNEQVKLHSPIALAPLEVRRDDSEAKVLMTARAGCRQSIRQENAAMKRLTSLAN